MKNLVNKLSRLYITEEKTVTIEYSQKKISRVKHRTAKQ